MLLGAFAVLAILVLRRQGRHDHGDYVLPPVDPGHHEPEQARDVNAEEDT